MPKKFLKLNKITFLVISYNRHKYLTSFISNHQECNARFIILDGSKTMYKEKMPSNMQYFHKPIKSVKGKIIDNRYEFGFNKIKTKYCALISDDELFIESGLLKIINFMDNNKDIAYSFGYALGFKIFFSKIFYKPVYYQFLSNPKIVFKNPYKRLKNYLQNFNNGTIILSVMRTSKIKKVIKNHIQEFFTYPPLSELMLTSKMIISGKFQFIKTLYYLRNIHIPPIRLKKYRHTTIQDFLSSGDSVTLKEKKIFITNIINALKKKKIVVDKNVILNLYNKYFLCSSKIKKKNRIFEKIKFWLSFDILKKIENKYELKLNCKEVEAIKKKIYNIINI